MSAFFRSFKTFKGWEVSTPDYRQANQIALATQYMVDPSLQTILVFSHGLCGTEISYGGAYLPALGAPRVPAGSPLHETMDAPSIDKRIMEMQTDINQRIGMSNCARIACTCVCPLLLLVTVAACPDDVDGMDAFLNKKVAEYNAADGGRLQWRLAQEGNSNQFGCMFTRRVVSIKRGAMQVAVMQGPGGQPFVIMQQPLAGQSMAPGMMMPMAVQTQPMPVQQPMSVQLPMQPITQAQQGYLPPAYAQAAPAQRI